MADTTQQAPGPGVISDAQTIELWSAVRKVLEDAPGLDYYSLPFRATLPRDIVDAVLSELEKTCIVVREGLLGKRLGT